MPKINTDKTQKDKRYYTLPVSIRTWIEDYESETTFEVLWLDDLYNGNMTFKNFVKQNIRWFEDWSEYALNSITSNLPEEAL